MAACGRREDGEAQERRYIVQQQTAARLDRSFRKLSPWRQGLAIVINQTPVGRHQHQDGCRAICPGVMIRCDDGKATILIRPIFEDHERHQEAQEEDDENGQAQSSQ